MAVEQTGLDAWTKLRPGRLSGRCGRPGSRFRLAPWRHTRRGEIQAGRSGECDGFVHSLKAPRRIACLSRRDEPGPVPGPFAVIGVEFGADRVEYADNPTSPASPSRAVRSRDCEELVIVCWKPPASAPPVMLTEAEEHAATRYGKVHIVRVTEQTFDGHGKERWVAARPGGGHAGASVG